MKDIYNKVADIIFQKSGEHLYEECYEMAINILKLSELKAIQVQAKVKPACEKKCENCLYCREDLVCEHIRNRAMMILEDDERFFIYPNFGCNNFESKSV